MASARRKAQAQRLGVEQVIVDVRTRADAENPDLAAKIDGAGLIYLSGGNPAYFADTLRDTAVWAAIVAAHRAGAALAGCSAGAMALADWAPWGGGGRVGLVHRRNLIDPLAYAWYPTSG